ncbi:low molecular weight protein-tyrosine-phosphatase [Lysobacter brunescens]|uniref:protein-tyrosine-phosphatase n=1 Tax=Lysobacter brunescens TaxID=262323 RepID=A0ABW2YI36_9GAMM
MRLLMVCLGNICRSPLAEGAVRAHLDRHGLDWVEVDSAGTGGWHAGEPPDRRSIAVAASFGVDIRAQRARKLVRADFTHFDWLLCADRSVLRDVRAAAPAEARERAALLLEWAGQGTDAEDAAEIPDPYTGGPEDFRRVWDMVDAAAAGIVARIARGASGRMPG